MKNGWEQMALGEILQLEYGKPLDETDRKPNGRFPVYGANGEKDRTDRFYHQRPSIIVGRKGSAGEINLTEEKFWPLDVTYFVTFDEKRHDLRFLYYLLTTLDLPKLAKGVKPGINRNEVYSQVARVPLFPEQLRIVRILDEAFEGIATAKAAAEKNLQNARALFDSHLQSVFTQAGKGWVERRLWEVFEIGSSKRIRETEWTSAGVPFYGGKEIVRLAKFGSAVSAAYISEEKYRDYASKYDMPRKGDILITARGTIGVGYVVKEGDKFYYKDGNIISFREKTPTNALFVLYAFRSKTLVDQFADLTGATVKHLPIERAKDLVLKMPTFATQNSVVEHLENIEKEAQRLESIYQRKLAVLEALKKSLLHQAFASKL